MPTDPVDFSAAPDTPAGKAALKALAKMLAKWQPPQTGADGLAPAGKKTGKAWSLAGFDPAAKPFSNGDKQRDKAVVDTLAVELDELQNLLYADKRFKLLVILQGTDTAGKDGTMRGVFGRISPLGVHTVSWKAPSEEERAHDYLWRIHRQVPASGEITIFNRSHYEDVLVPPVKGWITPAQTAERYRHINDFERLLAQTGTVILKFMLHISKDEQRERLQARLDDPAKQWKFNMDDLEARKQWKQYQQAYEDLLGATSTPWAPWTVVPSDSKTHRNLMIATVVRATLVQLGLRFPLGDPSLNGLKFQ
ncbi:PPK2 family polyphosphate kinase [Polaromonas sp. YR568]|uniref:PPK2 family polyphosphate kinase n=1 Tax=Polaromonas sp. YR568 TaxID=1855301 RepID=UPI00398C220D